jgi:hypothetical protein
MAGVLEPIGTDDKNCGPQASVEENLEWSTVRRWSSGSFPRARPRRGLRVFGFTAPYSIGSWTWTSID